MVHTTFHQKQDMYVHGKPMPMCRVTPQFVTACNIVEHLQSYMKHDMCHAHLGQCKGIWQSKNIIGISALWVCSSAECSEIPSEKYSKWAGLGLRPGWNHGPETGLLTHLPPPWPAQARSQWLVASGQIFTAPSHHGRGQATEPADWWPPSCKMDPTSERSVQWQYLSLFKWDRCFLTSLRSAIE